MGNCLGSRKPSGNRLDSGPANVPQANQDAAAARERRLAAAENRQQQQQNRGVQGAGGKLSKSLQAQKSLKPGQEQPPDSVERVIWD
ncbi:hypothetical protein VKS41_001155 [Umbelopsis sp. WA50703]